MKFALVGVSGTQDAWGSREEKEAPSGCPGAIGSPGRALDGLFRRLIVSVVETGRTALPDFHNQHLSCANESLRSRLTLREEGEVAGLESPNGLGAGPILQALPGGGQILFFAETEKSIKPQICADFADTAESPIQVPETPSAFHSRAQRNAFRRPDLRQQRRSVRPLESIAATQPQLHPALLRLSAMSSQYFTRSGFRPGCFTDC
jgi:hypothetical protein